MNFLELMFIIFYIIYFILAVCLIFLTLKLVINEIRSYRVEKQKEINLNEATKRRYTVKKYDF